MKKLIKGLLIIKLTDVLITKNKVEINNKTIFLKLNLYLFLLIIEYPLNIKYNEIKVKKYNDI